MSHSSEVQLTCSSCQATLKLPASSAGKLGKCPSCGATFTIPAPQAPPAPQTPPAPQAPLNPQAAPAPVSPYAPVSHSPPVRKQSAIGPPPLGLMMVPLYISAVLYGLLGIGLLALPAIISASGEAPAVIFFPFLIGTFLCLALAAFICYFTAQLPKRKKWAWITAIIFGAMYAPSAFVVLGILILVGAFRPEVMSWFNDPR